MTLQEIKNLTPNLLLIDLISHRIFNSIGFDLIASNRENILIAA
jgi:hypothetical protein